MDSDRTWLDSHDHEGVKVLRGVKSSFGNMGLAADLDLIAS